MSKKLLTITAALLLLLFLAPFAMAEDKNSLTRDGTAIDAGNFDQAQYDEFKKRLYEKSINDSLKCYEEFIFGENFYDANICLQTWRMHSKEIGTYDKDQYEALKERLKQARIEKAARKLYVVGPT